MDRRRFLAMATTTVTGLFMPAAGLVPVPAQVLRDIAGQCSFCHEVGAEHVMFGKPGSWARLCRACVSICTDILEEEGVPEPPLVFESEPWAPPPEWRTSLARAGFRPGDIDALTQGARPHRAHGLDCSFCGRPQRDAVAVIAGPRVYVCDTCVGGARRLAESSSTLLG
ncbi:MAG: ClpX C4-type zinc finger protein [Myxococcota bacterium]